MAEPSVESCSICGQTSHTRDSCDLLHTKSTMLVRDQIVPARAFVTLPTCLNLVGGPETNEHASQNDQAAADDHELLHGHATVEAKQSLRRGTWFGPLQTAKTRRLRGEPRIRLASIENRGGLPLWYDTSNPRLCNWMMLVSPADDHTSRGQDMANLLVVEHEGGVYFVAPQDIQPGETLRAAYSPAYKKAIGKLWAMERQRETAERRRVCQTAHARLLRAAKLESNSSRQADEVVRYICAACSICLANEDELQDHIVRVHSDSNRADADESTGPAPAMPAPLTAPSVESALSVAAGNTHIDPLAAETLLSLSSPLSLETGLANPAEVAHLQSDEDVLTAGEVCRTEADEGGGDTASLIYEGKHEYDPARIDVVSMPPLASRVAGEAHHNQQERNQQQQQQQRNHQVRSSSDNEQVSAQEASLQSSSSLGAQSDTSDGHRRGRLGRRSNHLLRRGMKNTAETVTVAGEGDSYCDSVADNGELSAGGPVPASVTMLGAPCHICLKWLSSAATLRSHIRVCQLPGNGELPDSGQCRYCGVILGTLPEYRRHLLSRHLLEHECPLCRARFRLESMVNSHACPCLRGTAEVHSEHRCEVCALNVGNLVSTEVHLRLGCQGHDPEHKCERCKQSYFLPTSLQRHLCLLPDEEGPQAVNPETAGTSFICETCGVLLSSTSALSKHRATHSEPGHVCRECGKSFHRRDGLETHLITHQRRQHATRRSVTSASASTSTAAGVQLGSTSSRKSNSATAVAEQEALFSPPTDELLTMPIRGDLYATTAVRTATTTETLAAVAAAATATTTTTADQATISASSPAKTGGIAKEYICGMCNKRLSSRSSLNVHLRGHGSKWRFSCTHCGRGYNQKINLEKHLISAHQSVRYWCESCERSFTSKESLELHSLDHQGAVRTHLCPLCPAAFHRAYQLRRHQRYQHNEIVYACPVCPSIMKLASSLMRHLRSVHHDQPDLASKTAEEIARQNRYLAGSAANVGQETTSELLRADYDYEPMDHSDDNCAYDAETRAAVQDIAAD